MTGAQVEDGGMAPSATSEQLLQERHPSAEQRHTAVPSSTQRGSGPYTPPRNAFNDLPTPPTSHIELSASTQPPTVRREGVDEASVSQRLVNDGPSDRHDDSPSVVATARRAKRSSGPPSSTAGWDLSTATAAASSSSTPKKHKTERDAVLQEQQEHERERRGRRMRASAAVDGADGYANINGGDGAVDDAGSSRSRTPSPITGHLSYPSALAPSPDEVKMLLYGEDQDGTEEASRPNRVAREEMQAVMDKLASMGLADAEAGAESGQADVPRERELAAMLKKVVAHAQDQEAYIDSLERGLHTTRISSISMMSSLRTKYAHELAQELSLRSRLEAELEGAQAQAKMLSAMLARSESRNEEQDRQRAMSAEEEVMWQEEMKGHASAYAQQQAARARAAQMAQAQAQTQVRTTQALGQAQTAAARAKQNGSPGVGAGNGGLEEPFELKAEPTSPTFAATEADGEGAVTGLGISAPNTTAGPQAAPSDPALTVASGSGSSPLSTIIKERNKLLSDKRYLKSRMRDAEAQRDRLEAELRSMRPLLVRGAPSKSAAASTLLASAPSSSSLATPGSNAPNTPSGRSQKRDRSRRRRVATMGDAEAEHLLLAARRLRVSHARTTAGRPQSSPSKQTPLLDDDGRPRTPPPRTPRTPRTAQMSNTPRRGGHDGDATVMMTAGGSPRNGAMLPVAHHNGGGGSPLARRNGASLGRWGTHERTDSMRSNGGIDELLQAAQTVLNPAERPTLSSQDRQSNSRTRGGSDAEVDEQEEEDDDDAEAAVARRHAFPSAGGGGSGAAAVSMAKGNANLNNESPKRRRVSTSATVGVDLASMSPGKRIARFGTVDGKLGDGMRRLRTSTEGAEPLYHSAEEAGPMSSGVLSQSSGLSALDLLADQAAASQQPSQSSDRSHSTAEEEEDELEVRSDMSYDGMAVDGEAHSHYYPRGAYGHSYAHEESYRHMQQQPPSSQPSSQQQQQQQQQPSSQGSGYTYSTPPLSHGWTSHQPAGPRNGVYAPRGSSPPSSGRYSTFGHGPRISSGDVHLMSAGKASLASSGSAPTLMMMMPESPKAGQKHSAQAKGGNTSPDKRLPYVRWSEEEDRKLRKAIADHGQRWEAVARVVGTRSYHQCRQRYLLMRRKEAAAKESATNNSSSGRSSGSPARHAPSATAAS